MKILTDNKLLGSTISSTGASANYPARNLIDPFLRLRYQTANATDTIEFELAEAATFDSFYIGYTGNLASIEVEFLIGDNVQDVAFFNIHVTGDGNTRVFEPGVIKYFADGPTNHWDDYVAGREFASRHFPPLANIDRVRINITGTGPIYIGGVGGGMAVSMPPAIAAWRDEYEDNSVVTRSPGGQVQQQYIEPYDVFNFSFDKILFDKFYEIKDAVKALGIGGGAWVTFFEDSEGEFPPGYYTVSMGGGAREENFYSFSLSFTEAR